MKLISSEKFIELVKGNNTIQVVDVREPYEYALCSVQTKNINIPMGDIVDHLNKLDVQTPLYLVCKSGNRASAVANLLTTQYKFTEVYVVEGGIEAYMHITQPTYEIY